MTYILLVHPFIIHMLMSIQPLGVNTLKEHLYLVHTTLKIVNNFFYKSLHMSFIMVNFTL